MKSRSSKVEGKSIVAQYFPLYSDISQLIYGEYAAKKESNMNERVQAAIEHIEPEPNLNRVHRRRLYFAVKRAPFAERTATVTFVDMISNIGGTLGLFCGFSLLSGVEFLYWTANALAPNLAKKRAKNNTG